MPAILEQKLLSIPYIYDFDDAFYLRYKTGKLKVFNFFIGDKFKLTIRNASVITAGNSNLANYAKKYNTKTHLFPSVVDTNHYYPANKKNLNTFTLGWIGSRTTEQYLNLLIEPLEKIGKLIKINFIVVGGKAPIIRNINTIELPWHANTEVDLINSFDVGVMPLQNDEWAKGKCAFKLIQYMACGIPVVASKVGANTEVVTSNCGFLVENSEDWICTILELSKNQKLREKMGIESRIRVQKYYSVNNNLPKLVEIIQKIIYK
jgi:glycosyltransferase involved in cell wall biosynthesis